jgi:protein-L-isoaspartate(D-aspartate) O-methyltransferase
MTSAALRAALVASLRRSGLIRSDLVARAFETVPREEFLAGGFLGSDGDWIGRLDDGFLPAVYTNRALPTKVSDGRVSSSTSQPSLMAVMLGALDVAPGTRVLEIGTGTGYNAALLSVMGARVTSVEVQPDVAQAAREALARAGADEVRLVVGDGYDGHPGGGPYDRVIVTVGVTGVSPRWLDQLAPGGFALVPLYHAGSNPVVRVAASDDGTVVADALFTADFVQAFGRAGQPENGYPRLPAATVRRPARWQPDLDFDRYGDLSFAAGAWHPNTTRVVMDGIDEARGRCAVLDQDGSSGALILAGGDVVAAGQHAAEYADIAEELVRRWVDAGRPDAAAWRATLRRDGAVWLSAGWRLRG